MSPKENTKIHKNYLPIQNFHNEENPATKTNDQKKKKMQTTQFQNSLSEKNEGAVKLQVFTKWVSYPVDQSSSPVGQA